MEALFRAFDTIALVAVKNYAVAQATDKGRRVIDDCAKNYYPQIGELIIQCAYSPAGVVYSNNGMEVTRVAHVGDSIVCYMHPSVSGVLELNVLLERRLWKQWLFGCAISSRNERSADCILKALTGVLFDVAFVIDSNMRIFDNNWSKVSQFFAQSSIRGDILDSFIPLTQDKQRLHKYIEGLSSQSLSFSSINLHLQLSGSTTECTVVAMFEEQTKKYLVGIRVPTLPPYVEVPSRKSVRFSLEDTIDELPEKDTVPPSMCSSASSSVISDWIDYHHRKHRFVNTLRRYVSRDFSESMHALETVQFNNDKRDWLVPRYVLSSPLVILEEVVASLPRRLHSAFIKAMNRDSYLTCSQLLEASTDGNANIFNSSTPLSKNTDLLHCVFRLFISRVTRMSNKNSAHTLVVLLDNARRGVCRSLGRMGEILTGIEVSLSLLSLVEANHDLLGFNWLHPSFIHVLILHAGMKTKEYKSEVLPSVYWLCLMWSCMAKQMGKLTEAVLLLHELFGDTRTYCIRHPQSTSMRQLQSIICYNLAMEALDRNAMTECLSWVYELQQVLLSTYISLPYACSQLIHWATSMQKSSRTVSLVHCEA